MLPPPIEERILTITFTGNTDAEQYSNTFTLYIDGFFAGSDGVITVGPGGNIPWGGSFEIRSTGDHTFKFRSTGSFSMGIVVNVDGTPFQIVTGCSEFNDINIDYSANHIIEIYCQGRRVQCP